jgi:hypothetical protein
MEEEVVCTVRKHNCERSLQYCQSSVQWYDTSTDGKRLYSYMVWAGQMSYEHRIDNTVTGMVVKHG